MGLKEAFDKILIVEGETYSNRPNDNGGPTKFGITLKMLSAFRINESVTPKDVEDLTKDQAFEVYDAFFWKQYLLDEIKNETLAYILFDQYVNRNPIGVTKQIQTALSGLGFKVSIDGIEGVQTINAINTANAVKFGVAFAKLSQIFYVKVCQKDPIQLENLGGWLARTHKMIDDILNQ